MTYDDHLVWPIHVPRRCEPLITPHLSLWGNARTRATFPTHKKSHNPHPQGEGGQDGYITLGGVGGGLAKPGSYIQYIYTQHIHSIYTVNKFIHLHVLVTVPLPQGFPTSKREDGDLTVVIGGDFFQSTPCYAHHLTFGEPRIPRVSQGSLGWAKDP